MILHLNTAKTWRGGEQQLYYLADGLKDHKIEQWIVGQPNSELEKRCKGLFSFEPIKMRGELDIFAVRNIINFVREKKIKLIHAHTAAAHSLALMTKKFVPELYLVVSRRVDFPISKNIISKRKYYSDKNDFYLTVSNRIKEVLIHDGIDPEKIVTVYSGIDLKKSKTKISPKYLMEEFKVHPGTIIIGNVAALVDHKDQETLLRAISQINIKKKFIFFIVGDGELESKLKELAKELSIDDKVIFTGFREDILAFYKMFDIFTLTSKEEGLGTSVLDAMSFVLPIVATTGGGIGEMLEHEKGALLTDVGDSARLAGCFERLISDSDLRHRLGQYNKDSVKKFSIENTIRKTIQVYYGFLGSSLYETTNH